MDLTKLTKQELEKELNVYENLQSVGVNDLRYLQALYVEADRRGYEINLAKEIILE